MLFGAWNFGQPLRSRRAAVALLALLFAGAVGGVWAESAVAQDVDVDVDVGVDVGVDVDLGGTDAAGIMIEPSGVLSRVTRDPSGELSKARFKAAKAKIKEVRVSPMRKVSLNRLEAAVKAKLDKGEKPTFSMLNLAGLTRLQYVFFLPETNDVVLAGPAEPIFVDGEGEARGVESLRPSIKLEDLVVALRAFPPSGKGAAVVGCSIDPTPEGLKRMQDYLKTLAVTGPPRDASVIVKNLRDAMGLQKVTINGVPAGSRFAQVMVAADYRMKLIGIGLEKPAVKLASYVDLTGPGRSKNALVRWYFTPNYEMVRVADDGLAMELVGEGVKLIGADELVKATGERVADGAVDGASQKFVQAFTKVYPELAAKEPVYAELRNLIDMVVAAAFIQKQDYYAQADWTMATFGSEDAFPVVNRDAPKEVLTVVTAVWKGSRLLTPVGGGVNIQPKLALAQENLLTDEGGKLDKLHDGLDIKKLAADRWWWD